VGRVLGTGGVRWISTMVVVLSSVLVASGCYVNQQDLWASDKLSPDVPTTLTPTRTSVQYGPEDAQHLDLHRPVGNEIGVIIWVHSGGWCCGDHINTDPLILDQVRRGYAVVAVDHRRTPEHLLETITLDVDRAIRFVKSKRVEWGIETGRLVLGGGSAGGHLALLAASAPNVFVAPDLPANLRVIDPHVDAVISFVGPSDLQQYADHTITSEGINGPYLVEMLLGCSNVGTIDPTSQRPYPRCTTDRIRLGSPLFWAHVNVYFGSELPPVYLAYGMVDGLVPPSSQAEPLAYVWQQSAGFLDTWLDLPPAGGHNLSYDINRTAFELWLSTFG